MLFQKLLKPASAATGIQYVGGYTMSSTTVTSNVTVSLTSLTGGVASSPSIGDLVILYFGVSHNSTTPPTPTATGYTTIALLNSDDSHDARLLVAYKLLSAADTSITINANSVAGNALSVYVSVWRNVDATYPFDVAATTATGQNSVLANPPAITPITAGSYIIAGGEGAHVAGTQTYSSSDLTNFLSSGASGSNRDSTIGGGYNQWTSGSFNPAAFTFSGTNNTAYSWAAATLALRPAGLSMSYIASSSAFDNTGLTTLTCARPTGAQAGDLIVAFSRCAADGATIASVQTMTNIVTATSPNPSSYVGSRVIASGDSTNYNFTRSSGSGSFSIILCAFRYGFGSVNTAGTWSSANSSTCTANSITTTIPTLVLAGFCWNSTLSISTPPSGMTAINIDQNGFTGGAVVYYQSLSAGSTGNKSLVFSGSSVNRGILYSVY